MIKNPPSNQCRRARVWSLVGKLRSHNALWQLSPHATTIKSVPQLERSWRTSLSCRNKVPPAATKTPRVVSSSLRLHRLYSPWNSPGQNTGVGSLSLLQGIFPTQGSNLGLQHCGQILYHLSHKGSPRILEWVAYPFSSGSSRPRNQTRVSCIAGGFFTNWAIREAQDPVQPKINKYFLKVDC